LFYLFSLLFFFFLQAITLYRDVSLLKKRAFSLTVPAAKMGGEAKEETVEASL
jgi:hypothetical protein